MEAMHPLVRDPLPIFISGPDQTDILFNVVTVVFIASIFAIGILYLRIHSLPDKVAHGTGKIQLQLVSVLCLISLFTHNHLYWIAGLLLAFVELPDFSAPIRSMARSLRRIADRGAAEKESPPVQQETASVETPQPIAETTEDQAGRKE